MVHVRPARQVKLPRGGRGGGRGGGRRYISSNLRSIFTHERHGFARRDAMASLREKVDAAVKTKLNYALRALTL